MKTFNLNMHTYPKQINYKSFIPTSDKMKRVVKNACPEMTKQCIMKCYKGNTKKKISTHGYGSQENSNWGTLAGKQCLGGVLKFDLPSLLHSTNQKHNVIVNACVTEYNGIQTLKIKDTIHDSAPFSGAFGSNSSSTSNTIFSAPGFCQINTNATCKGVYTWTGKNKNKYTGTFIGQGNPNYLYANMNTNNQNNSSWINNAENCINNIKNGSINDCNLSGNIPNIGIQNGYPTVNLGINNFIFNANIHFNKSCGTTSHSAIDNYKCISSIKTPNNITFTAQC